MIDFPTFPYTSASKSPPFHIPEGQIRYSFWAEPPRIGHCGEYLPQPPGYVSRIFLPLNLDKSLNIHKETVSYRTLIVPIKVNQLPSYRTSKISLNEYLKSQWLKKLHLSFFGIRSPIKKFAATTLLPIARINQVINRTVGHSVNKIQFFNYLFLNLPNLLEKLSLR